MAVILIITMTPTHMSDNHRTGFKIHPIISIFGLSAIVPMWLAMHKSSIIASIIIFNLTHMSKINNSWCSAPVS